MEWCLIQLRSAQVHQSHGQPSQLYLCKVTQGTIPVGQECAITALASRNGRGFLPDKPWTRRDWNQPSEAPVWGGKAQPWVCVPVSRAGWKLRGLRLWSLSEPFPREPHIQFWFDVEQKKHGQMTSHPGSLIYSDFLPWGYVADFSLLILESDGFPSQWLRPDWCLV